MVKWKNRHSGLSVFKAAAIVAAISTTSAAGWLAYQHNRVKLLNVAVRSSAATIPSQATAQPPVSDSPAQPAYAAWPVQSDKTYGLSFNLRLLK